jgi:hypothetical protein
MLPRHRFPVKQNDEWITDGHIENAISVTVVHSDIASCMGARSFYVSEILKISNWEGGKWNR